MKELFKTMACAMLALLLAPAIGFWVVAATGASMGLLPLGAAFSKAFPKTWGQMRDSVFTAG